MLQAQPPPQPAGLVCVCIECLGAGSVLLASLVGRSLCLLENKVPADAVELGAAAAGVKVLVHLRYDSSCWK